jgi:hypothetical protein
VSRKRGRKFSYKLTESNRQVCVGDRLDGEVAAPDNEPDLLPERLARVNVLPARLWKHTTKLRHGTAAEERIDSSEEPNHKD